jgi:REP element-mobilizing transposase RayT
MPTSAHPRTPFEGTSDDSPPYDSDGPIVTSIEYYVLLVTKRRRPHFADPVARERVEELLDELAETLGCRMTSCEVKPSTALLQVRAPSTIAPHMIVRGLRRGVVQPLKAEFDAIRRAGSVFVRPYLLATVPMPDGDCEAFERRIPTR